MLSLCVSVSAVYKARKRYVLQFEHTYRLHASFPRFSTNRLLHSVFFQEVITATFELSLPFCSTASSTYTGTWTTLNIASSVYS